MPKVMLKILKMVSTKSKPLTPLLLGLCLGITLSLIVVPFHEGTCPGDPALGRSRDAGNRAPNPEIDLPPARKTKSLTDSENHDNQNNGDYENGEDYEPRIRTMDKPPKHAGGGYKKRLRPRYASTELGIREKLYVGVLTSRKSIESMGVAVNKTLAHFVTKLVFFMDARGSVLPGSMSVVSFSDERTIMRPFHMFKYIGDHYVKNFDWFYFITDETYVRGENLFNLVSHISISQNVVFGSPLEDGQNSAYCNFDAGILISQPVMSRIYENLEWCAKNADSLSHTENIGKCITHAANQACKGTVQGLNYTTYLDEHLYLHKNPQTEWSAGHLEQLNSALSVNKVDEPATMFKLHRYFSELELNYTRKNLERTKDAIVRLSPKHPEGPESASWPIGIDPPSKPKNRFDVIKWEYFTETHLYLDSDFSNMKPLTEIDVLDMQDVLNISMRHLNDKYGSKRFSFQHLKNGYRRFDPTRGMEYMLDLILKDTQTDREVTKRVNIVRPLGYVELVPMPYVTENSRVNIILPVTSQDKDGVVSFLDSYAKTCLETGDNSNLHVVFVYENRESMNSKNDPYSVMKSMINYYENKYVDSARMVATSIIDASPTEFSIADAISKKLPLESLILVGTVGMELTIEFLNRVRMNTIVGWQVYFPTGFWQYKPSLVYTEKPYPTTIEISKNVGHFDANSYCVASFYNKDYTQARKKVSHSGVEKSRDLFEMFLKYHKLHVFRAIEPALRHKYREIVCNPVLDEESYSRCLTQKSQGLASRSQLAMLIFEHQQNLDKGHLDVIKKQNNPIVDQMKPNMLKKRKK